MPTPAPSVEELHSQLTAYLGTTGYPLPALAHGIGTSRAFTVHPDAGAWASLGMGLHGVVGAVLIPLAFRG